MKPVSKVFHGDKNRDFETAADCIILYFLMFSTIFLLEWMDGWSLLLNTDFYLKSCKEINFKFVSNVTSGNKIFKMPYLTNVALTLSCTLMRIFRLA